MVLQRFLTSTDHPLLDLRVVKRQNLSPIVSNDGVDVVVVEQDQNTSQHLIW